MHTKGAQPPLKYILGRKRDGDSNSIVFFGYLQSEARHPYKFGSGTKKTAL